MGFAAAPAAQAQMTINGTVTDQTGQPVQGVEVFIQVLRVSAMTRENGTYSLLVPAARMAGVGRVTIVARRLGYQVQQNDIALVAGSTLRQDFTMVWDPFLLEAVVVTGQGLEEERKKLGTTISTVKAEEIAYAHEIDVVSAIAGKAPNVEVTTSTGDPGGGTYIRIRGSKSIEGGTQPLIVIDGQPVTNATHSLGFTGAGVANQNRAADINPDDIESIEILKGPAATGIYGSRASSGVVLITTKSGKRNSTRMTFKTSLGIDDVNRLPDLQTRWGQGLADPDDPTSNISPTSSVSWGPELAPGTPVFDHAREMFETGYRWENALTLSGGTERTTYYLSTGYLNQNGAIKGKSAYQRFTARLKGSHDFLDDLTVGGNFAYTTSQTDLVQQGSNISGMLLGAFRTPPEFNNLPYIDPETGLHRSYRYPQPTELVRTRGYDNPFWVANEIPNTADVDRFTGNVNVDYEPFNWLRFKWILGADFANDQRVTIFPKSSSEQPVGRIDRAEFVDNIIDHSLLGTIEHSFSPDLVVSLSAGQNLNQAQYRRYQVTGENLIFGTQQLDFAVDRVPDEFTSNVRTEGYFADLSLDLWDQLFVKGGLRYDGSNTFGGDIDPVTGERESSRFWYPKASVAWEFSRLVDFLDFAKLRAAFGQAGRQPPVYSNVSAFTTGTFGDGWLTAGLESIYKGYEGTFSETTLGNANIVPETTTEVEGGLDLAFLENRISLGGTVYWQRTEDAILALNVTPSTGYFSTWANGAEWRNWGWEATVDLVAAETPNFSWRISGQWAKNNSMVDTLLGAEEQSLAGFASLTSSVVPGHPFGVFYGSDFVRFGRGITVNGVDIDNTYSGWTEGDLYICDSTVDGCPQTGFPIEEPRSRVVGDPNPDWTASLRSTFTLFKKVRVSGLLDIKHGGDVWNGTKGALFYFGKHAETTPIHEMADTVFATCDNCGPGAGNQVQVRWDNWAVGGPGSGFTGPSSQFVEHAGFVKLRDVSISTTLKAPWLQNIGFDEMDLTASGRNLITWTRYTGLDPEANLTGQSTGRGLEYFNHPQTRTFAFTVTLRR